MCNLWKVCHTFDLNVSYIKLIYPEILLIKHVTVIFEELTSITAKSITAYPLCGKFLWT